MPFARLSVIEEVPTEEDRVPIAGAQRRYIDREYCETVQQVLAQQSVADGLSGIAIGRRDDAQLRAQLLAAADPIETAGLEKPQQAHLQIERHLGDFVQEERAALRAFDQPAMQCRLHL